LTGIIKSVKRCTNAYTGGTYYRLRVDSIGLKLDVLLKSEDVTTEPVVGGYIHGTFYLTARLFPAQQDECLTPCFTIETTEIIESFDSMIFRDDVCDVPHEGWELFSYPIMPDGSVLLIFQNASEVDGNDNENSSCYYRFLRYDEDGTIIDKRQTKLVGGSLNTAYYDANGHLHLVFQLFDDDEVCMFDMDDTTEPEDVCSLGYDISRIITDSEGNVFVGRDYSCYPEDVSGLISIYGANGTEKIESHFKNYRCSELVLDDDENVWCLTEPITSLYKVAAKNMPLQPENVAFPLSCVLALAISKNGSRMFCECKAMPDRSRFFMLTKKSGQYAEPMELRPPLIIQERCHTYGMCATSKDRILFNVDGVLFLFRLEDERCNTLKDLGRIRIKKRTENRGQHYGIKIDPSASVSDSSLAYYVEPILLDMYDMPGESLTIAFSEARKSDAISFIQVARNGTNYHLEIAVCDADIDCPYRIYALLDADFDTVFSAFKTVIVESGCPDFTKWVDYTEIAFGRVKSSSNAHEERQQILPDSPIEVLDLSVRGHNRLVAHGIMTVGQLINCPISELKQIKGLGKKCLSEIRSALSKYGYELRQ
jgi:hypothetical protein